MEAIAGYGLSSSESRDSGSASSLSDFEAGPPAPPPPEALIKDESGKHNKALINEERFFVRERIPTLIFVRLPDSFADHANKVLTEIFPSFNITDIHCVGEDTPLHVSLSRRLRLKQEDAHQLLSELKANLKRSGEVRCSLFSVRGFKNEGNRRSFVGLPVYGGFTHLLELVKIVNSALKKLNYRPFHKHPRPHASIAWQDGPELYEKLKAGNLRRAVEDLGQLELQVAAVELRIGTIVHAIPLG
ncbi:hypothetical protein NDN08_007899 [Rhodosorus marinus]|uniref:U6 snRNA phosphodiesterase 1 n=1 Tax=Rhodosorus marinus TaxID=101924 RepID=A0AAV8V020_9RHOD|nr:hypothetical protein NDN08_007899 [Rhodosorus marinus]